MSEAVGGLSAEEGDVKGAWCSGRAFWKRRDLIQALQDGWCLDGKRGERVWSEWASLGAELSRGDRVFWRTSSMTLDLSAYRPKAVINSSISTSFPPDSEVDTVGCLAWSPGGTVVW